MKGAPLLAGILLVQGLVVHSTAAQEAARPQVAPESAAARVLDTARAAVARSPALEVRVASLASAGAAARAEAASGPAYVEAQVEGLGSDLGRRPNAQNTLRVGKPFTYPWHLGEAKDLREAAARSVDAGRLESSLAVASMAGSAWLELAAVVERVAVVEERLERLSAAVKLQQERLRLGEVAGAEVLQLELEQTREVSQLAALEAERADLLNRLEALCGDGVRAPVGGDLVELMEITAVPSEGDVLTAQLQRSPALSAARLEAETERARAEVLAATAWGRPEAEAEWEHLPSWEGIPSYDAFGLRLNIPLPLGKQGREVKAIAAAEARAAEAAAATVLAELTARTRSNLAAAAAAEQRLLALEPMEKRLPRAEHSLAEQFRLGAVSYLIYIDGLSRLDGARLDVIDARRSMLQARLELAAALADPDCFPLPIDEDTEVEE